MAYMFVNYSAIVVEYFLNEKSMKNDNIFTEFFNYPNLQYINQR